MVLCGVGEALTAGPQASRNGTTEWNRYVFTTSSLYILKSLIYSEILFVYVVCWFTIVKDEKFESGNRIKHDGWCHECCREKKLSKITVLVILISKDNSNWYKSRPYEEKRGNGGNCGFPHWIYYNRLLLMWICVWIEWN
jgi:hypothetical protein